MSKTILITDADTPLGSDLVRRCLERGDQVLGLTGVPAEPIPPASGARAPGRAGSPARSRPAARSRSASATGSTSRSGPAAGAGSPTAGGAAAAATDWTRLEWRRHNPVSSLNGLLSALNRHDRLDEALVINSPPVERTLLHETPLADIEEALDGRVKGNVFLVREIIRVYLRQGGGSLAMINYIPLESGALLSPLESTIWGSYQALADSLLASCAGEPYLLNGFASHAARPQEFAEFILDTLRDKAGRGGRWHRFQVRSGLLSSLRLSS